MTGDTQENWLKAALTSSGPVWNVIANQVIMFEYDHTAGSGESYYMDGWDGYVAARNRILKHLYEAKVRNPIVITGDMHSSWVANLKYHPTYPNDSFRRSDSVTVGTEFTGPESAPTSPRVGKTRTTTLSATTLTSSTWTPGRVAICAATSPQAAGTRVFSWRTHSTTLNLRCAP